MIWNFHCFQDGSSSVICILVGAHEKKIGHRDCSPWAHGEFTVSSRWPKWSQPAVPGPWLSWDLAVTEPWSPWLSCDWAVTYPWLSCDLAETELWPRIIGPRSRDHGELTVTIYFLMDDHHHRDRVKDHNQDDDNRGSLASPATGTVSAGDSWKPANTLSFFRPSKPCGSSGAAPSAVHNIVSYRVVPYGSHCSSSCAFCHINTPGWPLLKARGGGNDEETAGGAADHGLGRVGSFRGHAAATSTATTHFGGSAIHACDLSNLSARRRNMPRWKGGAGPPAQWARVLEVPGEGPGFSPEGGEGSGPGGGSPRVHSRLPLECPTRHQGKELRHSQRDRCSHDSPSHGSTRCQESPLRFGGLRRSDQAWGRRRGTILGRCRSRPSRGITSSSRCKSPVRAELRSVSPGRQALVIVRAHVTEQ